jgi:YVTN family beta-propeller protein
MQGKNSNRSYAFSARGFAALWVVLVLVLAFSARPAEAAPFAYVSTNSSIVSVIDTATNKVVTTIPVGNGPVVATAAAGGVPLQNRHYSGRDIRLCDE